MGKVQGKGLSEYFQFYVRNNHLITMCILRFYSYVRRDDRIVILVILTQKVSFPVLYLLLYKVCKPQANFSKPYIKNMGRPHTPTPLLHTIFHTFVDIFFASQFVKIFFAFTAEEDFRPTWLVLFSTSFWI